MVFSSPLGSVGQPRLQSRKSDEAGQIHQADAMHSRDITGFGWGVMTSKAIWRRVGGSVVIRVRVLLVGSAGPTWL